MKGDRVKKERIQTKRCFPRFEKTGKSREKKKIPKLSKNGLTRFLSVHKSPIVVHILSKRGFGVKIIFLNFGIS